MHKCQQCGKYAGEPKPVAIGDKCNFTITTTNGRSTRHRVATGRLLQTGDWGYSVSYRKNVYRCDVIAHPDDPSPISLAMCGLCECVGGDHA